MHLTVADVAKRWACSTRSVQRAIEDGRLRALRFGPKLLRIRLVDLEAYEEALLDPIGPPAPVIASASRDARMDDRIRMLQARALSRGDKKPGG
jgi:excisionase family DNA binding protein